MARFLNDANLPRRLSIWMSDEFDWVVDHDETWTDSQVWNYARQHDLIIVTKDADFSERIMPSQPPPRVIHLKIGNLRLSELRQFLIQIWPTVAPLAQSHKLLIPGTETVTGVC